MDSRKSMWVLVVGIVFLFSTGAQAANLTPNYLYTVQDAVTGSNFIPSSGWYVTPGADSHVNDFTRERPLGNQDFSSVGGQWVHPGQYYAYLDIVSARWGYDNKYLYFKQELYGNWSMSNATDSRDYGVFGSGTLYDIILNQNPDPDRANGSVLLRITGDAKETWLGPSGQYLAKGTQGWQDSDNSVSGNGITVTKENGDSSGNGYEYEAIKMDGYLDSGPKPEVLFARVTGAALTDNSMPYVEIAFDYETWNSYRSALGLQTIAPLDIKTIVFETNRGLKDNQNYLWNDKYTQGEEGSPYNILDENGVPITQLGNVYELDRAQWAVPVPPSVLLLASGLLGLVGFRRKFRR